MQTRRVKTEERVNMEDVQSAAGHLLAEVHMAQWELDHGQVTKEQFSDRLRQIRKLSCSWRTEIAEIKARRIQRSARVPSEVIIWRDSQCAINDVCETGNQ